MALRYFAVTCLLSVSCWASQSTGAQASKPSTGEVKGPKIAVVSLTFENVTQLSTAQQQEIIADIESRTYKGADWLEEVDERIRYAWQKQGYFKASAHSNAHQRNDDLQNQEFEVVTNVDEGKRFLLSDIQWLGDTASFTREQLDATIPLHRMDAFEAEKVRTGLESLRKLFATHGYLDFAAIPDTAFNDDGTIDFTIKLMPKEVYRVGTVNITGGTAGQRKRLQQKWPLRSGDAYNPYAIMNFIAKNPSMLPSYVSFADNVDATVSKENHTVDIAVHLERR